MVLHQSISKYKDGGSTALLWEIRLRQLRECISAESTGGTTAQGCSASAFPGKPFSRRRCRYVLNGIIVLGPVTRDNS